MTIKKLTFCILCLVNAANLAADEDLNNKNSWNSGVEKDILITKNNWNTKKWGSIYFLFQHLNIPNLYFKDIESFSFFGILNNDWGKFINIIASGVVEYKYMFQKYCGINIRLNLNNSEVYPSSDASFFSFETSLEWIYGRKGKHIFGGSFSPLGGALMQNNDGSLVDDFCKRCWTLGFVLLKYEYDRRFYLNFGKVKATWYSLKDIWGEDFWECIGYTLVSIEFGVNILGVNDWRKKRKKNIV